MDMIQLFYYLPFLKFIIISKIQMNNTGDFDKMIEQMYIE